jgi:hypothetical protein
MVVLCAAVAPAAALAQQVDPADAPVWDVVQMSDGTVWRGVIVEQVPGKIYRIALLGGSVVVVDVSQVVRVTREPNPGVRGTSVPPLAASGFRLSVLSGVAVPTGNRDFYSDGTSNVRSEAGLTANARVGYEIISGSAGITPAAFVEYTRLGVDDSVPVRVVHTGLELRAAMHLARLVPYAALGFGADIAWFDAGRIFDCESANTRCEQGRGFGMHFAFGSDVLVTRHFALGLQITMHPGITDLVQVEQFDGYNYYELNDVPKIGYFAVGLGASLY